VSTSDIIVNRTWLPMQVFWLNLISEYTRLVARKISKVVLRFVIMD